MRSNCGEEHGSRPCLLSGLLIPDLVCPESNNMQSKPFAGKAGKKNSAICLVWQDC